MGKRAGSIRKGRGRPRKTQEIIGAMVMVHAPEMADEALFASSDKFADPIEELGTEAKLDRISQIIRDSAREVGAGAKSVGGALEAEDRDLPGLTGVRATSRPWLEKKSPVNVFSDAKRAIHANGRVIDTLIRHLVEHVAIDQELREIATDARHRAEEELRDIPLAMVDFVNRLMASGVVARDVRFMPRHRLAQIVAAIKDVDLHSALADVPDNLPRSSWSDPDHGGETELAEVGGSSTETRRDQMERHVDTNLNHGSTSGASDASPVGPVTGTESIANSAWLSAEQGLSQGMWDIVEVTGTGYRLVEYEVASVEDAAALRFQLPDNRSMRAMALPSTLEETLAIGAEDDGNGVLAQRFVGRHCARTSRELTEEERRMWLFLLFEINAPQNHQLGRAGFFDGVRLPGPAGTNRIRRLVALDRNHLEEAAAKETLEGPAIQRK